jgi:hypothetical protein
VSGGVRTVMTTGTDRELLAWQQKVCLSVVRALVPKVRRPYLPAPPRLGGRAQASREGRRGARG